MNPNCCRNPKCADHNCPGRDVDPPGSMDNAVGYILNILVGVGVLAAIVVGVFLWGTK